MNPSVPVRLAAWTFPVLGVVALLGAGVLPVVSPVRTAEPVSLPSPGDGPRTPGRLDSVASTVTEHDLFRRSRRPAPAGTQATSVAMTPPPPPKPALQLVGLVAGAKPTAVIAGFPGTTGPRVVRVGGVISGLRVRRIGTEGVEVAGMDTTWLLTVRKP